ncbi:endonuclease G, partial [Paraburkholderia sp. BL9I2N2]
DMVRTNKFFEDARLPDGEGATLADYKRSGFDRGHMSPAGNRWNQDAMAQSFSLANVVPQNRENNQRLWARIETSVRKIAVSYDDTYVVTGPIFNGQQLQTIGPTRVFVPTQLFKVVYVPSRKLAFAVVGGQRLDQPLRHQDNSRTRSSIGHPFSGHSENLKDQRPED